MNVAKARRTDFLPLHDNGTVQHHLITPKLRRRHSQGGVGGRFDDHGRRTKIGRHQELERRMIRAGQRVPLRLRRQGSEETPAQIDLAPGVAVCHGNDAAGFWVQNQHVVATRHGKRSIGHVVVGIVEGQRFKMFDAARKVHCTVEEQLKLRREVHMGIDRRAIVEAETQGLRPVVLPGQQHLAGKTDPLGSAAFPGRPHGIYDVARLHHAPQYSTRLAALHGRANCRGRDQIWQEVQNTAPEIGRRCAVAHTASRGM